MAVQGSWGDLWRWRNEWKIQRKVNVNFWLERMHHEENTTQGKLINHWLKFTQSWICTWGRLRTALGWLLSLTGNLRGDIDVTTVIVDVDKSLICVVFIKEAVVLVVGSRSGNLSVNEGVVRMRHPSFVVILGRSRRLIVFGAISIKPTCLGINGWTGRDVFKIRITWSGTGFQSCYVFSSGYCLGRGRNHVHCWVHFVGRRFDLLIEQQVDEVKATATVFRGTIFFGWFELHLELSLLQLSNASRQHGVLHGTCKFSSSTFSCSRWRRLHVDGFSIFHDMWLSLFTSTVGVVLLDEDQSFLSQMSRHFMVTDEDDCQTWLAKVDWLEWRMFGWTRKKLFSERQWLTDDCLGGGS